MAIWRPNADHLARARKGAQFWNGWREAAPDVLPDLRGAELDGVDFRGADLANVDFGGASLAGANLQNATLFQVELYGADLRRADLRRSDMRGAKLHNANLTDADLSGADLFRVDFIHTNLRRARFDGAQCWLTAFTGVDLSETLGLDDVRHVGPSSIDTATLVGSYQAGLHNFLRQAGVPESLLRALPPADAARRSDQFYSCFISYSTEDDAFAHKLHSRLIAEDVRAWFSPKDVQGGKKLHEQIRSAIRGHDRLLLVLSEHSMSSNWVMHEVFSARRREAGENRQVLFPIRLCSFDKIRDWEAFDADLGKDAAREVREFFIPDFSEWQDETRFEEQFARLVRDLRKHGPEADSSAEKYGVQ